MPSTNPYRFHTEPMAHQRDALRKVIECRGVAGLLMEPGLGKTWVAINYAAMLSLRFGRALVFVAAPLSALDTWPDEVDKHLPPEVKRECIILKGSVARRVEALRALEPMAEGVTVVITNHDAFSHSHRMPGTKTVTTRSALMAAVRERGFDLGVVDESHRIKSPNSNVSRAFASMAGSFPRRLILTGTVAPHSPMDVWAQWRFLNPQRFGTRYRDFTDRYAYMGGFQGKQVVGYRNLDELSRFMSRDAIVVKKADALDLPPVTDITHHVHLTPRERKAYLQMASALVIEEATASSGEAIMAPTQLVQWMRLRQLTSGHVTHTDSDEVTHFGSSKVDTVVDLLRDLTEAGEKVVVFAHFVDDVKRTAASVRDALPDATPVEVIYGAVKADDRRTIRKQFLDRDGPMVVVAQMRTVSLAVNEFVAASHAIFLSMSERRDDFIQARDRLHRKGQERPIFFHHIVVPDSIDEVVLDSHQKKGKLEAAVLKHARRIASLGDAI